VSDEAYALAVRLYDLRNQHLGVNGRSETHFRRFCSVLAASWGSSRLELRSIGLGPRAGQLLVSEILARPPSQRPWLVQLDHCLLGDVGVTALAHLLVGTGTTVWLSACANSMGPVGATALFEAIANHNSTLTGLDLSSEGAAAARNLIGRGLRATEAGAVADAVAAFAPHPTFAPHPAHERDLDEDEEPVEVVGRPAASGRATSANAHGTRDAGRPPIELPPRASPPHLHARPAIASLGFLLERSLVLTVLRLGSNALGPEAAAEIGLALPRSRSLVELSLPSNGIGPAGAAAVAAGATQCLTLETLDLGFNELGDAGALAIGESLAAAAGVPMPLDPREAPPDSPGSSSDGGSPAADSARPTSNSKRKPWPASGPAPLATYAGAALPPLHLSTLNLSGNRIGPDGARALSIALRACPALTSLRLARNDFGDAGALAFALAAREAADALGSVLLLTELVLASNGLGEEGGSAIAQLLSPPPPADAPPLSERRGRGRGGPAAARQARGSDGGAPFGSRSAALQLLRLDLCSNLLSDGAAAHLAHAVGRAGSSLSVSMSCRCLYQHIAMSICIESFTDGL